MLPVLPSSKSVDAKSEMVPVRLRGHHFLCLLTYKGYGYTPDFVKNMTRIVERVQAGCAVELTEGPDDICRGLTPEDRVSCDHDCTRVTVTGRDEKAIAATAALIGFPLDSPFVLTRGMVGALRAAFATGASRAGCVGCTWESICTDIAHASFAGTILFAPHNHESLQVNP